MPYDIAFVLVYVRLRRLLEDNKVETLRFKDQVEKLTKIVRDIKMEITQERERSSKMSLKLQEITKDKEDLLIRYIFKHFTYLSSVYRNLMIYVHTDLLATCSI